MKRLLLLLLFNLYLLSANAINPFIKNYTIKEGLPTNKYIHIYQDSQEFIWFASDAGVIRYDGNNFVNYSTNEGMSGNIVMRIKEDNSGRIWFLNKNGTVNYFYNNTLYNEKNDSILKQLNTNFYLTDFYEDTDSTLYFYNSTSDVYALKKHETEVVIHNFGFNNRNDYILYYLNKTEENKFQMWTVAGIYECKEIGDSAYFKPYPEFQTEKVLALNKHKTLVQEQSGFVHTFHDNKILKKNVFSSESQLINSVVEDSEGLIWIATYDKGIYCYDEDEIVLHLNIKNAQGIIIDGENNIWITSEFAGIFKINREILSFQYFDTDRFDNLGIKALEPTNSGEIWATNGKSLFIIDNNNIVPLDIDFQENNLSNIYHFKNNTLITNAINSEIHRVNSVTYDKKNKTLNHGRYYIRQAKIKKIRIDSLEQTLYSFVNDRLIILDVNNDFSGYSSNMYIGRINDVFINYDYDLVINATKNYLSNRVDLKPNYLLQPYNGQTITSHLVLHKNHEVYNIEGNQLILRNDEKLFDLAKEFREQIDYRIKDMAYADSTLFFFTSSSVYFIKNPLKIIRGETLVLNRLNIEFNNINDIISNNDKLYIGSNDGLVSIPIKDCVNTKISAPKPYFYKVSLDDENYDLNLGPIVFKNKKRLSIDFSSLNYSALPSNYSYQLEGIDDNWTQGKETRVVYLNLPTGNYTFKLKARKGTEIYSNEITLPVIVKPLFFQRTILKLLFGAVLLFIIFIIYWSIYKNQIKRKETDNMLITLEHKALQSMMNPHFIFNALGSIQRYLLLNKSEEAGAYLSQFARLIRQNMNSLKSNYISIDDEVERLRNYLDLEKFRMNNKFGYTIHIDKNIDGDDIGIPSMIVQPFVENAIWHGVSLIPEQGEITIHFNLQNDNSIKIKVEDNGVGIQNTESFIKSERNLNMGVSITKKRLKIIGNRYNVKSEITTEEVFPGKEYPGTRIILVVPILT